MAGLELDLSPTSIPAGEKVCLTLSVRHQLPGTLHNLCICLVGWAGLMLFSGERLQYPPIPAGNTVSQELYVQGKQPGRALLRLQTISGKVLGRTERFPDVTFRLDVFSAGVSAKDLSVIHTAAPLNQNQWGQVDLLVQNLADIPFEAVSITLHSRQVAFDPGQLPGSIDVLPPGATASLSFPALPGEAGDLSWIAEISARAAGQPVQKSLQFTSTATPDTRPQDTHLHQETIIHGDVVQTGSGNVIGSTSSGGATTGSRVRQKTEIKGDFVQTGKGNLIGNTAGQIQGGSSEQSFSTQGDFVQTGRGNVIGNAPKQQQEALAGQSSLSQEDLPQPGSRAILTCPNCKQPVKPEDDFCDLCGQALSGNQI